mgnify:CR=1 FL=1
MFAIRVRNHIIDMDWQEIIHKLSAARGENSGNAVITENEALEIIQLLLNSKYDDEIAELYNISISSVDYYDCQ